MSWFEVSKEGLKELQSGKSKTFIVRELVQNAWDENIRECKVDLNYGDKFSTITVEDDSPEGFRNIADAYTLFGKTYKRADPTKRGRFNLGEKQVLAICEKAVIETTKGTIHFTTKNRIQKPEKREKGSLITLYVKLKKYEFQEIQEYFKELLIPENVKCIVNRETLPYKKPYKTFEATLLTEKEEEGILGRTMRKTDMHLVKSNGNKKWLYEMGIPVQEIDCEYGIDIQQKIPLGIDRETVLPSFLKDVYAEALNQVHEEITPERSSEVWIREGASDERISKEAVQSVIKQRYGDKVCVANPRDRNSIDEAVSRGYKVVYGSEMSGEEWDNIKKDKLIQSSTELFGANFVGAEEIQPDENMKKVKAYARKIARRILNIDLSVSFVKSKATVGATFGNNTLTFNVSRLGKTFFEEPISIRTTDLIVHELGHYNGHHTEKSYHELLTRMAGELVMAALKEPEFFNI